MNNRASRLAVLIQFLATLMAADVVDSSPKEGATHGTHDEGMPAHWTYMGVEGPEHWGMLDDEYMVCEAGRAQSPININITTPDQTAPRSELVLRYKPSPVHVVNNGHTVQVNYQAGSTILFNGKEYKLRQFHFHEPSEHHVEGAGYPMEMHLVHQDASGHVLVVGVLIRLGAENTTLSHAGAWIQQRLGHRVPWEGEDVRSGLVMDVRDLLPKDTTHYYSYHGSLTTPPCTQGVQWIVFKEPMEVSEQQVQRIVGVVGHNARPIQMPHGREVEGH